VETTLSAVGTAAVLAGLAPGAARDAARAALLSVGLGEALSRTAGTLSSGQRARLTLAVALACPAALVCLDEPTAHLDSDGAPLVAQVMEALRSRGTTVLVATHDPAALSWPVDARLRIDGGRVAGVDRSHDLQEALAT
jgi:ABC-type multidrug transport system ATPase subunit